MNVVNRAGLEALGKASWDKYKIVPGWNEHVKDLHSAARISFLLWTENGKPRFGPASELMRNSQLQLNVLCVHVTEMKIK